MSYQPRTTYIDEPNPGANEVFAADLNTAFGVLANHDASFVPWSLDPSAANGVTRLRHATWNFLGNASLEYWLAGTNVPPSGWISNGGVAIAQSSTATVGSFSAQMTFDTTNTGEFYSIFGANNVVDYTYSCYAQRLSGNGNARLVAQQHNSPFSEYVSVPLSTTAGWQLATLTVRPANNGLIRWSIKSADNLASVWLVDECFAQESKGVSTAWNPRMVDDTNAATIYGAQTLANPVTVLNTSTPATPTGGGTLFVQGGALKYIGSSGTVTTLAAA